MKMSVTAIRTVKDMGRRKSSTDVTRMIQILIIEEFIFLNYIFLNICIKVYLA